MPWFKVDDKFHSHPKVMALPPGAVGIWTLAGTWCADYLTDGHINLGQIKRLGGTQRDAARLVEAGLWLAEEDGYRFRDWHDYQPTKEAVDAEREASRERQRKRRELREKNKRDKTSVTDESQRDTGVTPPNVTEEFVTPVPDPVPEVPKGTSTPEATAASDGANTAQKLVGEWIDNCAERPPGKVIGQLSKEIKTLLEEGQDYQQVRTAVQVWNTKGTHPSVLPSVLHELRNKRAQPPRQSAAEREMQIAKERHERIGNGQLGKPLSWDQVFQPKQIEDAR